MINRQELREQERRKKKLQSWLKSFNSDQKMLWESTILSEIEKNDRTTMMIIDKCYMASIANNIGVDILDLEKIIAETSTYMQDYKDKIEKGDVKEMIKTVEKPIQTKMRSFIKAKKDKVESIKELEREYNVPFAELDVMWLQVKSKMGIVNKHAPKKNVAEEEVKEVMEETKNIVNIDDKDLFPPTKLIKKEIPYSVTEKEIGISNEEFLKNNKGITIEEAATLEVVNAEFKAPTTLKIKAIEVEGKYGVYIKDAQGVKIGAKIYKDITEVEEEKNAVERRIDAKKEELRKQIEKLSKELGDILVNTKKETDRFVEIEQVFAM